MKRTNFLPGILCLILLGAGSDPNPPSRSAIDAIRADVVREQIEFLAADSLRGRDTPSRGLDIAAEYIAGEFRRYGLQPLQDSYYQKFGLNRIRLGEENFVKLSRPDGSGTEFEIKREFMPFEFTANKEVRGELVFVGYGITAPKYGYDDYDNLDVAGRVVLVLRHEPQEEDRSAVFDGKVNTEYSRTREKVQNAIAHGAAGLLLVTDPLNHRSLRPRGFPWPSLYRNIPNEAIPLTLDLEEENKIPVVQVGKRFISAVFGSVDSLESIQKQIDATLRPRSFAIESMSVHLKTSTHRGAAETQNVAAVWEGTDLKDQAIVIGAHYDHVGYIKGKAESGQDYIFNGADDNASGTVGLLQIARAFSIAERPRRSVIFIAFAGEEKGLYGSRVYVETPLWPLEQTKAMFNMDMIGRNDGDAVTIIGYSKSPDLHAINREENRFIGLDLRYDGEQYFRRSDQYNFARKGIPVLFYNTGEHEDYHRVSDNPDKVNAGKIAMIARLVFRTTWRAANTDQTFRLKLH